MTDENAEFDIVQVTKSWPSISNAIDGFSPEL